MKDRLLFPLLFSLFWGLLGAEQPACPEPNYAYEGRRNPTSVKDFGVGGVSFGTHWFELSSFTMECWMKPSAPNADYNGIVGSMFDNNKEEAGAQFQTTIDQKVMFLLAANSSTGIDYQFRAPAPVGQWTHIVGVVNETIAYIYINGVLSATRDMQSRIVYLAKTMTDTKWVFDFYVGRFKDSNEDNSFVGFIDEVRYWNYPRTPEQILANYDKKITGPEDGLLLLVSFDRISSAMGSTVVPDESGFNHNGEISIARITQLDPFEFWPTSVNVSVLNCTSAPYPLGIYPQLKTCGDLHSVIPDPLTGLYVINGIKMYCDHDTLDGSYLLIAQFVQGFNTCIADLPSSAFKNIFQSQLWVDGYPGSVPTSPNPPYQNTVVTKSHDFKRFLVPESLYQLRVQIFKNAGEKMVDHAYSFYFKGSERATILTPSLSIAETIEISDFRVLISPFGEVREISSIILPYGSTDDINSVACVGSLYGALNCSATESTSETSGSLVISDHSEYSGSSMWAPFPTQQRRADIAYLQSNPRIYGTSLDSMTVNIWLQDLGSISMRSNVTSLGHSFSQQGSSSQSFDYLVDSARIHGGTTIGPLRIVEGGETEIRVSASPSGQQFVVHADPSITMQIQIELKWCVSGFFVPGSNISNPIHVKPFILNANPLSYFPEFFLAPVSGYYDNNRCLLVSVKSAPFSAYLDFGALSLLLSRPLGGPGELNQIYQLVDFSFIRFQFTGPFSYDPGTIVKIADTEDPHFISCQDRLLTNPVKPGENAAPGYWRIPEATDNSANILLSNPVICGVSGAICFPSMQVSAASTPRTRFASFPVKYSPYTITYTASDLSGNVAICKIRVVVDFSPIVTSLSVPIPANTTIPSLFFFSQLSDLQIVQLVSGTRLGASGQIAIPTLDRINFVNSTCFLLRFQLPEGYAIRLKDPSYLGRIEFDLAWSCTNSSSSDGCAPSNLTQASANIPTNVLPDDLFLKVDLVLGKNSTPITVCLLNVTTSVLSITPSGVRFAGYFATLYPPLDITAIVFQLHAPRGHLELLSGLNLVPSPDNFLQFSLFAEAFIPGASSLAEVRDYLAPQVTCPPDTILSTLPSQPYAAAYWSSGTVTDNVDPSPLVNFSIPWNASLQIGEVHNTLLATDESGNRASCQFRIRVLDTELPSIVCPDNINNTYHPSLFENTSAIPIIFAAPSATDNSRKLKSLDCSYASGALFPLGNITKVFCYASDFSNNTRSCSFIVGLFLSSAASSSAASSGMATWIIILIFLLILAIVVLVLFIVLWRWRRHSQKFRNHDFHNTFREIGFDEHSTIPKELPRSALTKVQNIGSGAFGDVFKAFYTPRENTPKYLVAIKQLKVEPTAKEKKDFLGEAALMAQIRPHSNLINLVGVVTVGEPLMIVLEFAEYGSLVSFVKEVPLSDDAKYTICRDIARGMNHLASAGFIHRDLSARNVLLSSDYVAKVSDFGLSRGLEDQNYYTSGGGQVPVRWTSIEALESFKYSSASDVWSYGVTVFELFTKGEVPYKGWSNAKVWLQVKDGYRLPCPPSISDELYGMLLKCWEEDPSARPSFSDLVQFFDENLQHIDDSTSYVMNEILSKQGSLRRGSNFHSAPLNTTHSGGYMASNGLLVPVSQKSHQSASSTSNEYEYANSANMPRQRSESERSLSSFHFFPELADNVSKLNQNAIPFPETASLPILPRMEASPKPSPRGSPLPSTSSAQPLNPAKRVIPELIVETCLNATELDRRNEFGSSEPCVVDLTNDLDDVFPAPEGQPLMIGPNDQLSSPTLIPEVDATAPLDSDVPQLSTHLSLDVDLPTSSLDKNLSSYC